MSTAGSPLYNPATGLSTIADTNELIYATTTLSGSTTAGATSLVVASATGFGVDQYIQVDANGSSAEIVQITAISSNTLTVYPATSKNHSNGVTVASKVARQIFIQGDATTPANVSKIAANGANLIALGNSRIILTSASAISTTNVKIGGTTQCALLVAFWATGSITGGLNLYDEGATPSGSQADCIWGIGSTGTIPPADNPVVLNVPLTNGLSYALTGALPSTVNVIFVVA